MPAAELDADTDAGTDAGATLECPRPVGLYRILATELEGDCGDFEGVARLGEDSGLCAKDTEYRDAGCTIDLDTFCEEEESDGSLTTRRTRGTLRRSAGSLDYTGMIEFAIQSSVEAPCSGSFELRWEWIGGGDAG